MTSSLGDMIGCIPPFFGSEFINLITWLTSSIRNLLGSLLYGNIILTDRILSLTNRICLSIDSTCRSASQVVKPTWYGLSCSSCRIASNAPSASMLTTLRGCRLRYILSIARIPSKYFCLLFLRITYDWMRHMCLEKEIRKVMPLTNITSMDRCTSQYSLPIIGGISFISSSLGILLCCLTVFPFRAGTSGP